MSTQNLATTAGWVVAMAACSMAAVTAWLLVTSPTTVAMAFYDALAHLVRRL
jgi:hypothetical protein